jgi:hypothetical protein
MADNKMKWTKEQYDDYMRTRFPGRASNPSANVESNTGNGSLAKKAPARFTSPCRCHIHSVRSRLADSDGISGKAAIDGIVHAGILENDSPEHIKEVSYSQEKGFTEKTIITLTFLKKEEEE